MPESFEAHLSVDRSIVELLSKSTYQRNFAYALREMVSNAYDADATKVTIDVDKKGENITIQDNGSGMTREDFSYYLRIAGKRRGKVRTTKFDRRRIGQFGVGFLSVFPFCKTIKVVTTTANSDEVLTAQIPAADFFKRGELVDVEALPVKGLIYKDASKGTEHHTTITLQGLTDSGKAAISRFSTSEAKPGRRSVKVLDWPPMERLKWELQEELPLAFPKHSPYLACFNYAESELIQVTLNGDPLTRNDLGGDLLDHGLLEIEGVKAQYAIITPWKAITPIEMRHIKLRLNNVGVGPRTDFDIQKVRAYSRLAWLSGEVHILDGLDGAISLSRDTFLATPIVESMYKQIVSKVRRQATYVETIEENRKTISKHIGHGKQKQVASTKEVVDKSVQRLKERGFKIETVQPNDSRTRSEPVRIDRAKKIVTIVEDHPSFQDDIQINGNRYKLFFKDENSPDGEPCILNSDGSISIYTRFPLFRSKRYGEVFERVCILIAVARKESKTATEMYQFIIDKMNDVFKEYH